MNFNVTTNWEDDFIDELAGLPVEWVSGRFPQDLTGAESDPEDSLPLTKDKFKKHVAYINSKGLQFNYLMDSHCLNNREYDRKWVNELVKFIQWLVEAQVKGVTVFIPYLVEIIKHKFPQLKVGYGTTSYIRNVTTAKYFSNVLGVDWICLHPEANRDFKLLKAIKKAIKCDLYLTANSGCLNRCPFMHDHCSFLSHCSAKGDCSTELYHGYFHLLCQEIFLKNPHEIIKADFIRPEDTKIYETIGYENFIIKNNSQKTKNILPIIRAYTKRKYKGNLLEILTLMGKKMFQFSGKVKTKETVYLDNQKLNNFLEFFVNTEIECYKHLCTECRYCMKIAKNALCIPQDVNKILKKTAKDIHGIET